MWLLDLSSDSEVEKATVVCWQRDDCISSFLFLFSESS